MHHPALSAVSVTFDEDGIDQDMDLWLVDLLRRVVRGETTYGDALALIAHFEIKDSVASAALNRQ